MGPDCFITRKSFLLFIIICFLSNLSAKPNEIGTFWQVTDFHYDANYSTSGSTNNRCHKLKDVSSHLGDYGDFLCDSPYKLVESTVQFMAEAKGNPDFILWTGDNTPHVDMADLSEKKVYKNMANVTAAIKASFPHLPVYPVIGNHDIYEAIQVQTPNTTYYKNVLMVGDWNSLLTDDQDRTFTQGGFYRADQHSLRILVLNTNLYVPYYVDGKVKDPGGQLWWLEKELTAARKQNIKVLITGHVPPGAFARNLLYNKQYDSTFNRHYLALLRKYSDVVTAHIYGHEHTDGYHVLYDDNPQKDYRTPLTSLFMSPSVTPWKNSVTSNNPSVRLYIYDKQTAKILDYKQYYMDLREANKGNATWKLEYQASKAYDLDDITAENMHKLTVRLHDDHQLFDKYIKYNSVSYNQSKCSGFCRHQVLCAISMLAYPDYDRCLNASDVTVGMARTLKPSASIAVNVKVMPDSSSTYGIMIGFMTIVIIMFVALMIVFRRGVRKNTIRYSRLQNKDLET